MIISILGLSGKKGSEVSYDAKLLDKKSGEYLNSTDFLLKNYDDKFYLLGTVEAIEAQKKLLELEGRDVEFLQIELNSLDDIFDKVYELISTTKDEVILDITHGLRHQPISAIFSATLHRFINKTELKIIFALEVVPREKYRYIYLDEYLEMTQLSLLMTGFIKTLNFMPSSKLKLINSRVFEEFSNSLLSNDLRGVEKNYPKVFEELEKIEQNKNLRYLSNLADEVKDELSSFEGFSQKQRYQKYLILSKLTLQKNYLVISLAYLFESLREYCTHRFESVTKDIKLGHSYKTNTSVMDTITNFKRNGKTNNIQKRYPKLYQTNKTNFQRVASIYEDIRKLRNDLAHINQTKEFKDIDKMLSGFIFKVETLFRDDVLKFIKI